MKKLILGCISIFLLCGCSAVYNLDIGDNYKETIKISPDDDQEVYQFNTYPQLDAAYYTETSNPEDFEREEGVDYYNYKLENNNIIASFEFKNKYYLSNAAHTCFPSFEYLYDENIVRLNTLADFECFNQYPGLKSVMINITVPYEVVLHNADTVSGNTYTWIYVYDGSIKSVDLQFRNPDTTDKEKNLDTYEKYVKEKSEEIEEEYNKKHPKKDYSKYVPYLIGLCGLFFVGIFVIIIYGNKRNR